MDGAGISGRPLGDDDGDVARVDRARSSFFDLSVDLLCIASLDGRFLDLNPAWTTTLGWELDELVGRQYLDFVHPDDLESTIAAINDLRLGQSVMHFRNRCSIAGRR